jgi:hypothetical protein
VVSQQAFYGALLVAWPRQRTSYTKRGWFGDEFRLGPWRVFNSERWHFVLIIFKALLYLSWSFQWAFNSGTVGPSAPDYDFSSSPRSPQVFPRFFFSCSWTVHVPACYMSYCLHVLSKTTHKLSRFYSIQSPSWGLQVMLAVSSVSCPGTCEEPMLVLQTLILRAPPSRYSVNN